MNIFALQTDPYYAAIDHHDKHVVKMILETAQMLCTNCHHLDIQAPYKPVMLNHPCTIWARKTSTNFKWLIDLGIALCREYEHRYKRVHKSFAVIKHVMASPAAILLPEGELTKFAEAMPDHYKHPSDPIQSYRNYYIGEKVQQSKWTNREVPSWIAE